MSADLLLAPSGLGAEDYVVKHQGQVVGRLYHTNSTPTQVSWFWSVLITPQPADCRGHEPTKEAAMAAFRARWDLLERG